MPQVDILDLLQRADAAWERRADAAGSMSMYEQLLTLSAGSTPVRRGFRSRILSKMALIVHQTGPPQRGIELVSRALEIDRGLYGEIHNDVAADLLDLAWISTERN
jgi:hypothetical protein